LVIDPVPNRDRSVVKEEEAKKITMRSNPDKFLTRLAWLTLASALLIVLWYYLPRSGVFSEAENAAPRLVTPHGDLAADERSTIDIFEKSKSSVVFITTKERVMDVWTRNVFSVPKGRCFSFVATGHVRLIDIVNPHLASAAYVSSMQ
jgi:hypothetical protein